MQSLAADEIADLGAVFMVGDNGVFAEDYEGRLKIEKAEQATGNAAKRQFTHLIEKRSLPLYMGLGAGKFGRTALAVSIAEGMKALKQEGVA
jgi:hypothetical protein